MHLSKYLTSFELDTDQALLLSALTGAVDIAPVSLVRALKESPEAIEGDTLAQLVRRGYLLSSPEEESRRLKETAAMALDLRKRSKPKEICICPTFNCNLACTYCFERDATAKPEVLGDEQIDAMFTAVDKVAEEEQHPPMLQLFGGEPLMPGTHHAVERILSQAKARGLKTGAVTNGVSILHFAELLRRFASELTAFQITIDGPPEIHNQRRKRPGISSRGTFDDMTKGIDFLLGEGMKVAVRVNVDRHNISSLVQLAEIIVDRGWHGRENFKSSVAPVQTHCDDTTYPHYMREDELVRELTELFELNPGMDDVLGFDGYRLVRRIASALGMGGAGYAGPNFHYCEACLLEVYVFGADGYIYPCSEAITRPDLAIGRFWPKPETYESRMAQWQDRSALSIDKCLNCSIVSFCAGGCPYAALNANGDVNEPVCGDARKVLDEYVRYAAGKKKGLLAGQRRPA